jgi:DNA-binding PadR family transcriptional regulator
MKPRKLSLGAVMILHAVARGHGHGFDLQEETGLTSGTVYPTLEKLETAGLLRSSWEEPERARAEKRPPRRYFEITAAGKQALVEALDRYGALAPVVIDGVTYPPRR